jgi:hypothetical protein
MTDGQCAEINDEVLTAWRAIMVKEHCTPAVLVGIGHDHVSGEIHVIHREGTPTFAMVVFLEKALDKLRRGN